MDVLLLVDFIVLHQFLLPWQSPDNCSQLQITEAARTANLLQMSFPLNRREIKYTLFSTIHT